MLTTAVRTVFKLDALPTELTCTSHPLEDVRGLNGIKIITATAATQTERHLLSNNKKYK